MNYDIQNIIKIGWQTPLNEFYNVKTSEDQEVSANRCSYYSDLLPSQDFSVEVSNQKMLASLSATGKIKSISFFREAYYTEDKPGTWASNGFVQEQNLDTEVEIAKQTKSLSSADHQVEYDLMFNIIPRFIHHYPAAKVLQLFLPIYQKNGQAISGLIELCAIKSKNKADKIIFPNCYHLKYSDRHHLKLDYSEDQRVLAKKSGWLVITDPNATFNVSKDTISQIISASFIQTKRKFGRLEMKDNPKLAALIMRKSANALNSICCSTSGEVVGANWGSSPVINRTWLRDMFYASLPTIYFDHDLAKKIILWFAQFEIKPRGDKFAGGIQHSVVNSLNSTILLTLYLQQTNDIAFLRQHPQVWEHILYVINYLIAHRDQKYGLVQSEWLSDGIALGKFHTGTQIALWAALSGLSKIYRQVLDDEAEATYYAEVANDLKNNIKKYCLVKDKKGNKKFPEGINPGGNKLAVDARIYEKDLLDQGLDFLTRVTKNQQINLEFHDGEETDTTLAPFYGFNDVLDQCYLNTLKFAASSENPSYSSLSKGISWGNQSEATFPGYITLLMGTVDESQKFDDEITLLSKLTDLDGSWWWWPYEVGKSGKNVVRFNHCGKCGWSDGTFSVLMIKNLLGIKYDASERTFCLAPLKCVPSFTWQHFPLTNDLTIDIAYQKDGDSQKLKLALHGTFTQAISVTFSPQKAATVKSERLTVGKDIQLETEVR
ncbi:hypothetical protein [Lactobacillus sp.]|uniref:hypothetical protein n=1 Tax=Lactobacillus sp. TaxID=1591 RepID=UPI0025E394F7|nr:hypothetical protein [Lactobacillus sp.]MCO6535789.1 hypothetical protein [Lactobacillus sp.]